MLQDHRARQAEERLKAGREWRSGDDYVLTTGWGGPIHPDTVSSLVTDLIAAHNAAVRQGGPDELLPPARLHDLRHVHATTLLLERGYRYMSSRPAWGMPIRQSRCGSTPT